MYQNFVWTEQYSVNVEEIDMQHKQFFKICNDLLDNRDEKSLTKDEALIMVMRLGDYASYHLGTEEELFIKSKYPDAASHIIAHHEFREKVKNLLNRLRDEKTNTRETVNEAAIFAGEWLLNHILIMDKTYTKFFNDHGII